MEEEKAWISNEQKKVKIADGSNVEEGKKMKTVYRKKKIYYYNSVWLLHKKKEIYTIAKSFFAKEVEFENESDLVEAQWPFLRDL